MSNWNIYEKDREKFEKKIFEEFPEFFRNADDPMKSLMCFGVEIDPGWHDLIYKLLQDIKALNPEEGFEVVQIKEKFGGLRFYTNFGTDEIFELIHKAEDASYKICEICGKKGKLRNDIGWYLTLCNDHYKERKQDLISKKQLLS